jgi:BirA family transcriptional regulator, biotin operon repressor / biotin---[acetyl-CoA-carboxylase] ligase
VPSPYSDLDRPPLRAEALNRALTGPEALWREIRVVPETASTNTDLAAEARAGAAEGLVLVAESQTAGRGRLDRTWTAPPRAGLTFSVLLRPAGVPVPSWGWLPLLAGVAVSAAVGRLAELELRLKWPNDVLVGDRKVAGILAERADGAAVVGMGLNVTTRTAELPVPAATSLALAGAACTDRDPLLRAVLRELDAQYRRWRGVAGDPGRSGLLPAYRERCATLGRQVRVELPGGGRVEGEATEIDASGRLVVMGAEGVTAVGAGDVVHVR